MPGVTDSRLQDPTPGPSRDHTRSRCLSLNGLSFYVVVSFCVGFGVERRVKNTRKSTQKYPQIQEIYYWCIARDTSRHVRSEKSSLHSTFFEPTWPKDYPSTPLVLDQHGSPKFRNCCPKLLRSNVPFFATIFMAPVVGDSRVFFQF